MTLLYLEYIWKMEITSFKLTRKEQVHNTALELFKEKGYAATGMREIAEKMDMKAASLYSHIKSKEEILQNVCFEVAHHFFNGLEGIEKNNFTGKMRINAAIHSHIKVIANNKDKVVVFLNEWKHLGDPYLSDFIKLRSDYENKFKEYIQYGMSKGEFDIDDLDFTTFTILSSLNWTSNWFKRDGKMTENEIADKLATILIKGIS